MAQHSLILILMAIAAHAAIPGCFEAVPGNESTWHSCDAKQNITIFRNGFSTGAGARSPHFEWRSSRDWNPALALQRQPSTSYLLRGSGTQTLVKTNRLRSTTTGNDVAIDYYFGPRGFEFDIEVRPDETLPPLSLVSSEVTFSRAPDGRILADGESFMLAPVAYSVDRNGQRHPVASIVSVQPHELSFSTGPYPPDHTLIIDPVVTAATYLASSGDDDPLLIREMPDGTLVIAGNSWVPDMPRSVVVSHAGASTFPRYCFASRINMETREVLYTAYIDADSRACRSADIDSTGRVLFAGTASDRVLSPTPDAQFPVPVGTFDMFLARISANGKTLEYASYLDREIGVIRAGPSDTVYFLMACGRDLCLDLPDARLSGLALARYNLALRRIDQQVGVQAGSNLKVTPSGAVIVFGSTRVQDLKLVNPIQSDPPVSQDIAVITAYSADFRTITFSTYLGVPALRTRVTAVQPTRDGGFWVAGVTQRDAIPGLTPIEPLDAQKVTPFAMQITTTGVVRSRFLTGGLYNPVDSVVTPGDNDLLLNDGRYCLPQGSYVYAMLACLNQDATGWSFFGPLGFSSLATFQSVAPSAKGGVWAVQSTGQDQQDGRDGLPDIYKASAIQPMRPSRDYRYSSDLLVSYSDLDRKPVLHQPAAVRLVDLRSNTEMYVDLRGANFGPGLRLYVEDKSFPLTVNDATSARFTYSFNFGPKAPTPIFGLPSGSYQGGLGMPGKIPQEFSDSFPVSIETAPPFPGPFVATADRLVFNVTQPFYPNSRVLWKGNEIPFHFPESGPAQVRIPADQVGTGEGDLTLINPPPGGGQIRVQTFIGPNSSRVIPYGIPFMRQLPCLTAQVDQVRKIVYTLRENPFTSEWIIDKYSLPSGDATGRVILPKNGARAVVNFELDREGELLYLSDEKFRLVRLRTGNLQIELEFTLPQDGAIVPGGPAYRITPLAGQSGSFVIATEGGQLVVFDGDHRRPYSTTEFPYVGAPMLNTIAASSTFVYATRRLFPNQVQAVNCVVRFPIDALGIGPPEPLCDVAAVWGKYPEMRRYSGDYFVEVAGVARQIALTSGLACYFCIAPLSGVATEVFGTVVGGPEGAYTRIRISNAVSGELIGHFPASSELPFFPSNLVFLDDQTLVFFKRSLTSPAVFICPDWPSHIDQAP